MEKLKTLLIVMLAGWTSMARSQVYIPTQVERDWLNSLIPGVVNGEGNMDTLHVGIATVDSAEYTGWLTGTVDFQGVGYLSELNYLSVRNISYEEEIYIEIDRIPSSLSTLIIDQYPGSAHPIYIPSLPEQMELLRIRQGTSSVNESMVTFELMPDTIGNFELEDVSEVTWMGDPFVRSFRVNIPPNETALNGLYIPSCIVAEMMLYVDWMEGIIDLSNTNVRDLSLGSYVHTGPILWPEGVDSLYFYGGPEQLTDWPTSLRSLDLWELSATCLPTLPDGIERLSILACPNLTCMPNWPSDLAPENFSTSLWDPGVVQFCSVLNTTCPGIYPGIRGSLFVDLDNDGIQDSDEFSPVGASVQLQPGNAVIPIEMDGSWEVGLAPGTYTIIPSGNYPYIQTYTPSSHNADVPNMGDIDTDNHFAVTLIPDIQDLRTWIYADPARPGFDNRLFLNYQNYGTVPTNTTLTLQWDADQQWVGSSVTPTSLSGNTATWVLGTLALAAQGLLTVDLSTLATVPLDTPIEHTLTAGPVLGDETPLDNVALFNDVVVGSYDPNDKLISPATMSPAQLQDPEARIEYTVRFQNTGTYLAERVLILDTLPDGLILESIQFLASSHANTWYLTNGVLHVIHNDIMLPDSTSDEPNSHGFIRFSIKPEPTLAHGATIANIAHIIFDFNEAIITPPAIFTVDVLASVNEVQRSTWSLWPNPTRDVLRLTSTHGALANLPYVVRDIAGRTVMTSSTSAAGDLPVGALSSGSYTVQVSGLAEVMRFVKE